MNRLKEFLRALSHRKPSLFLTGRCPLDRPVLTGFAELSLYRTGIAPAMFVPIFRDEYIHAKELISRGGTLIDLNRLSQDDAVRVDVCSFAGR